MSCGKTDYLMANGFYRMHQRLQCYAGQWRNRAEFAKLSELQATRLKVQPESNH